MTLVIRNQNVILFEFFTVFPFDEPPPKQDIVVHFGGEIIDTGKVEGVQDKQSRLRFSQDCSRILKHVLSSTKLDHICHARWDHGCTVVYQSSITTLFFRNRTHVLRYS
jgi:hypothetical protein